MYLFQRKCWMWFHSECLFTFHYVSISTIPGVYFIQPEYIFTFHYVSISTLQVHHQWHRLSLFTFHYVSISTSTEILETSDFKDIYIPLCIYFNASKSSPLQFLDLFTFHYVSISTCRCLTMYTAVQSFTFHYVSISTIFPTLSVNLSTVIYIPLCIYFNRSSKRRFRTLKTIYIPLCIYFNELHYQISVIVCKIYIPLCIYFNWG